MPKSGLNCHSRRTSLHHPQTSACALAVLALSVLGFASGCSDGEPVDLGSGLALDRSALSSYAAVWTGYIEAVESGSDRLRLEIDATGTGSVVFGEAEPLPLPSDPDNPFNEAVPGEKNPNSFSALIEGIAYPIAGAVVEEERLRARSDTSLFLDAACALQEPVASTSGRPPTCVPNVASRGNPEQGCFLADPASPSGPNYPHEVSCAKLELCRLCECDATECFYRRSGREIIIDAAFEQDDPTRLIGSLGPRTIRLERE